MKQLKHKKLAGIVSCTPKIQKKSWNGIKLSVAGKQRGARFEESPTCCRLQLKLLLFSFCKKNTHIYSIIALSKKVESTSLGQVKKTHMFLVRISIKKRAGGRVFLLVIISYCMLSLHNITFPQGYVGALWSNINKTKHPILIKHKFV